MLDASTTISMTGTSKHPTTQQELMGMEYFEDVNKVFLDRMRDLMTEKDKDREVQLRINSMERVMHNLDMNGVFGNGEKRLDIVINAEFMPPDYTNTERALRLNPREALTDWLEEIAEEI